MKGIYVTSDERVDTAVLISLLAVPFYEDFYQLIASWSFQLVGFFFLPYFLISRALLVAQMVKRLPAMWETWVQPLV